MSKPPSLFPSISFEEAVSEVASLSEEAYRNFKNAISSELAYDDNPDRIAGLANELSVTPEDAAMILQATSILYERVQALPTGVDSSSAISRFVDEFDEELEADVKRRLVARLTELTARNESAELNKKIYRLQAGFLDTATSFSTFVDLRPDFTEKRDAIRGFIPMIQFKIATNSDNPHFQELIFQVDEFGLERLRATLNDAQSKLTALRAEGLTNARILFRRGQK
jgi:hypothetical protein